MTHILLFYQSETKAYMHHDQYVSPVFNNQNSTKAVVTIGDNRAALGLVPGGGGGSPPTLGMVGRFRGDDPHCVHIQSNWPPFSQFPIQLTPFFWSLSDPIGSIFQACAEPPYHIFCRVPIPKFSKFTKYDIYVNT